MLITLSHLDFFEAEVFPFNKIFRLRLYIFRLWFK